MPSGKAREEGVGGYADCLSRVKGNLHARFLGEGGQRCSALTRQITLVWLAESFDSEIFFAGKFQKMISVLSAMTSVYFNRKLPDFLPEKIQKYPIFDCRVFQVPTEHEATNCFMWREQDATRNSVMMAAQSEFSHKECQNKNRHELMDMLMLQKNINWNNYPEFFKRGTYVRRNVL